MKKMTISKAAFCLFSVSCFAAVSAGSELSARAPHMAEGGGSPANIAEVLGFPQVNGMSGTCGGDADLPAQFPCTFAGSGDKAGCYKAGGYSIPQDQDDLAAIHLHRATIDDAAGGLEALCNDGTPAVIYVRAGSCDGGQCDKWALWIQGGKGCFDPDVCVERWCALGTTTANNYSLMSTRRAPWVIRDQGILTASETSPVRDWNHVTFHYCSSDGWVGANGIDGVDWQSTLYPDTPDYHILFNGASILRLGFEDLLDGVASDDGVVTMPALSEATDVLLTGGSAGSGGVLHNVDRLANELLPEARILAVMDAGVFPDISVLHADPGHPGQNAAWTGAWDGELQAQWDGFMLDAEARDSVDDGCLAAHVADPWRCIDNAHVYGYHVTTPMALREDLADPVNHGRFERLLGGVAAYPIEQFIVDVNATLERVMSPTVLGDPHKDAADQSRVAYGPLCGDHESLKDRTFLDVRVDDGPVPDLSYGDLFFALGDCLLETGSPCALTDREPGPGELYLEVAVDDLAPPAGTWCPLLIDGFESGDLQNWAGSVGLAP